MKATEMHVARLVAHPGNIREDLGDDDLAELAASIRVHGILQPLVVQPAAKRGQFVVLAGHRRLAAAQRAGLQFVPVVFRAIEANAAEATEIMLVENCQRRDLNPMEKAEAMGALLNQGYTQKEIAKRTGLSVASVAQYVALLDLAPTAREMVRSRQLPVADAIGAVRAVRAVNRKARGQKDAGAAMAATWQPDHFAPTHPLAPAAAVMCNASGHSQRKRLGRVACGQCWEQAIRNDVNTEGNTPQ